MLQNYKKKSDFSNIRQISGYACLILEINQEEVRTRLALGDRLFVTSGVFGEGTHTLSFGCGFLILTNSGGQHTGMFYIDYWSATIKKMEGDQVVDSITKIINSPNVVITSSVTNGVGYLFLGKKF